jgi:hypothetical protein
MEDLVKPVALNHEMVQTLDQIRAGAENALYGAGPAQAEELFKKHLASLIVGSGMPALQVMHYQWFLRELTRLWRTRKGRDLAFHLELCIRKWVNLGLEPRTLQFLICEAHQRLKGGALDCGSAAPAFPDRTDGPEKAAAPLPHSTELRSPTQIQSVESAKSVDVRSGSAPSAESASSAVVQSGTKQSAESAQSVDAS